MNLKEDLLILRNSKYSIFRLPQKSNTQCAKVPQWYQHRDQWPLGFDTGVWTGDEAKILCVYRATRIRVFPRNATIEKKTFVAERKISSLCTPLVDSAEQDSSRHVFWVSCYVKFLSSTIFAWLCDTTIQCNTRFSSVFISFNVGYVFSRQLIMRINLIFFAVILIPFIMINLFEKAKKPNSTLFSKL